MSKISQKFWREQFEKDFQEEHKKEAVIYNQNYVLWLEKQLCDIHEKLEHDTEHIESSDKTKTITFFHPSLSEDDLIPFKTKQHFINHILDTIEAMIDSNPEDWTNHNRFRIKTSLVTQLNEFENTIKESIHKKNMTI